MSKLGWRRAICFACAVCAMAAIGAPAQTLTTLYSFCAQTGCSDGEQPEAALVQATDGGFYGTTTAGGAHAAGTIFKITAAGALTTLYSFCAQTNCADGATPSALIQATDGNFYGTTSGGGVNSNGTVFKITPVGELTTLYSFCAQTNCTDGADPQAALVQGTDGNFYGTTLFGGTYEYCSGNACGTVFRITPGGALTTLHSFDFADGVEPAGALVQAANGNFYGTTAGGSGGNCGDFGCGSVFEITPSGTLTTLHSFAGYPTDGVNPVGGLVQATDGNFYGATAYGGANGTCTPLGGCGTLFKITAGGDTFTSLYNFCALTDCTDGISPNAGLLQASDGNLYGTTSSGGGNAFCSSACGTVFKITLSGALTTLHSFDLTDGANPYAGLALGADGNFYGTTESGGADNYGTVFRLGGALVAVLSPGSLSFDGEPVGTAAPSQTVTVTNAGPAALNISGIMASPSSFTESTTCGAVLAVGAKCSITVTFTPPAAGSIAGTLSISDSAAGSPQTVALSGLGQDFSLGPYDLSNTVFPGGGTSYQFKVGPEYGFAQQVQLTCSGAPSGSSCTLSPSSVTLDGSTHAVVVMQVSTTAPSHAQPLPPAPVGGGPWPMFAIALLIGAGACLALFPVSIEGRATERLELSPRRIDALVPCILLGSLLALVAVWAACGSSTPHVATGGTPAGNYTLTVQAVSGSISHSATAQLTVK